MSVSEFSLESNETWQPVSACTNTVTDGINLRELVLDGIDRGTKNAIIEFLKAYQLDVTGVDNETYTVDLTKWDRNRSEQFVTLLKTIGGQLPGILKDDQEPPGIETTATVLSSTISNESTEEGKIIFEEMRLNNESDIHRIERRFPIQPHPAEELDFEYIENAKSFPLQTNPIYQQKELLNIKPMLMREETQSTMGSANTGVPKVKKSCFSFKCVINWIYFPFRHLKRLKLCRFFRKHLTKTKSKEEKIRKEKAFAIYSSLLEEGPRFGREFRASLQTETNTRRTVATNTWPRSPCDDWSLNSEVSKMNRGINAVCQMMEIGVNTRQFTLPVNDHPQLREIPKVFTDPEEEPIIWCPCQFITSSFLYKCITKCLNYICDWEDSGETERIKQDIENQKEEMRDVRSMLVEALELMEKARKTNNEKNIGNNF